MAHYKRQSSYLHKQEEWKKLYESGMSYTQIGKQENVHYSTVQTVLKDVVKPRPKQPFADRVPEWKKRYEIDGWSINEIAKKDNVDPNTVSKYLKKAGVILRRTVKKASPYEKYIPEWVQLYKEGNSLKEIANTYDTHPQTVHKHIKDIVDMRQYTETSMLYELHHPDYLENIDSHEKAYWLGVWFGTGFISKTTNGYEATLATSQKDIDTLLKFKETIQYERDVETQYEVARLRIHNKIVYESLLSHGLIQDKINELTFPTHLHSSFYCSFILGYYEGKGSCYNSKVMVRNKPYIQTSLRLFGNDYMLQSLHSIIKEQTGESLYFGEVKSKIGSNPTVPCLRTNSISTIEKIASWMYAYSPVFSKHRDIRNHIKKRKEDLS